MYIHLLFLKSGQGQLATKQNKKKTAVTLIAQVQRFNGHLGLARSCDMTKHFVTNLKIERPIWATKDIPD